MIQDLIGNYDQALIHFNNALVMDYPNAKSLIKKQKKKLNACAFSNGASDSEENQPNKSSEEEDIQDASEEQSTQTIKVEETSPLVLTDSINEAVSESSPSP